MIKKYELTLTLEGELHIADYVIKKFEYLLYPNQSNIRLIDQKKLFDFLYSRRLENAYEAFIIRASKKDTQNAQKNLYKWLTENRVTQSDMEQFCTQKIAIHNFQRNDDIVLFMRNGNGKIYLPGSSVKGFLKTCLCAYARKNKLLDPLISGGLSVGDSAPISSDHMVIDKVVYYNPRAKKAEKIKNSLNRYVEFIKRGTTVKTFIAIDEKKLGYGLDELITAIRYFNQAYADCYLKHFEQFSEKDEVLLCTQKDVLRLGHYTNFGIKTINYAVDGEIIGKQKNLEELKNQFSKTAPKGNPSAVPVCLKLSQAEGKLSENGICRFKFKEL